MHPDEREPNWRPMYNLLQVSVELDTQGTRMLKIIVYPRVYSEERTKFMADYDDKGHPHREFRLPLPEWNGVAVPVDAATSSKPTQLPVAPPSRGSKMRHGRKLTYRFMDLPHHTKLKIAQSLGLIRDEDEGLRDAELYRRYFDRAAEMGKLADLWRAVENEYGNAKEDNPYEHSSGVA
jgi:hypothetical protein